MTTGPAMLDDVVDESPQRCEGFTDGRPCGVPASLLRADEDGRGWCWNHAPDPATRAAHKVAAARGGLAARARARRGLDPDELGPLKTVADAMRWSESIARATAAGQLSAAQANSAIRAVQQWCSAHDLHVRMTRLTQLEREVQRLKGMGVP